MDSVGIGYDFAPTTTLSAAAQASNSNNPVIADSSVASVTWRGGWV
ncbi:hypothetical protein OQ620_26055 [Klebsiella pneumoniae]|nr:hypothetical protein [Klebsiella pneumoniae]